MAKKETVKRTVKKKRPVKHPTPAQIDSTDTTPTHVDWSPRESSGYEFEEKDTCEALMGVGARDFPNHLWIEPRDWKDVARQNDKYKTWPEDWKNRYTNQSPTHECTCHAFLQNIETAWNRQAMSKKWAVFFSALSLYAEANPRRWGGSTMQYTLNIAMERGILPEHNGPDGPDSQKGKFEHTLVCTSGSSSRDGGEGWVPLNRFPTGWKSTARHFKPLEVINIGSPEEHICCVLQGLTVSNGRAGHAIPHVRIVWKDGKLYSKYSDSYDVDRYDSMNYIRRGVGGAYAIVTTTVPDDWTKPAG